MIQKYYYRNSALWDWSDIYRNSIQIALATLVGSQHSIEKKFRLSRPPSSFQNIQV